MEYLKAVNLFKKYLNVEKGYSKLTIKEYERDLRLLYSYLREEHDFPKNFKINEISKFELSEYLGDIILKKNNSPITRNRKLYSIRSFFKYLNKYDIAVNNPALTIEASKTEIRAEPIYMKLEDARKYIEAIKIYNSINKKRDMAIIKLFLYAGLRVSELVNLNTKDIDFLDGAIKFFGKGNKERNIPLHEDVISTINEYIIERKKIKVKNNRDNEALFLSRHGKRISVRSIQLMVKKYAKLAGVKNSKKITPHKLRHTFASMLYQRTKDIKIVQDILGHTNISTTQIYTHTDIEQRKEAIGELPEL